MRSHVTVASMKRGYGPRRHAPPVLNWEEAAQRRGWRWEEAAQRRARGSAADDVSPAGGTNFRFEFFAAGVWDGSVHFEFVQCFSGQYPSNLKGFFRASHIHHIGLRSCFLIGKNLVL